MKPRGHSNVSGISDITPWPDDPDIAKIPLVGGAHVVSCRPLPPLALQRGEWLRIGEIMGWATPDLLDACGNRPRSPDALPDL